ncbi:FecR family protein [Pedobacter nototheniae]|uniref:FecR family protein n=1 Tax=Pedobacter nototheniae TaxID=2488994 RepID=UPI0029317196|nr:FecR family protein [Pedobacter nototheniae]
MSNSEFAYLFSKYFDKTATAEERDAFMQHLATLKSDIEINKLLEEAYNNNVDQLEFPAPIKAKILHNIFSSAHKTNQVKVFKFYKGWIKYAAAILLISLGIGFYWYQKQLQNPLLTSNTKDILPGGNRAVLTLGNGKKVILDDAATGLLAEQGNIEVRKAADGQIVYNIKEESGAASVINTIETQNGGQYQINLPDGTKVWLNAASTLKYPTSFAANERKVELKGEAYFEVAKNEKKPFKVMLNNDAQIKVLGTHFNINAYPEEESINATLLEGSIAMSSGKQTEKIVPGQQAQAFNSHRINVVNDVNVDEVIAWKNGFFSVRTVSLQDIMKQVEKWYDVKVIYKDNVQAEFVAKLPRNVRLLALIKLLEYTKQVHFKLEGKTLYVMK